jgi:ABC-type phosphate transport system permease subunit
MIYHKAMNASREENRLAWAGILVLISLIFVLNLMIRFVARQRKMA